MFQKHFLDVALQIHVPYVCILPNVKLKKLTLKTEAAPKKHHDWGMSGCFSGRGADRF